MKDNGKMIYNMEKEQKHGQIVVNIMVHIKKEKNMDKVYMYGQMIVNIMENGEITK